MPWSHHSHSGQFCLHAKGTLRQVLDEAVGQGFELYGLSEHMPRYRVQDLYPEESHLTVEELYKTFDDYLQEAQQCRQDYADRLTLLIGLETDVIHPNSIQELQELLLIRQVDYVVGSIHHANQIPIDFDQPTFDAALASFKNDKEALFNHYLDAQYELLQVIQPEVIGHFDLCRLWHPEIRFQDYESTWAKVQRNVQCGVSYGALFEVNAAAFRKGWKEAYPAEDVLTLIMSLNGRMCLSDDSHGPHAVGLHYEDAYKYLRAKGVGELYYLDRPREGEQTDTGGRGRTVVRKVQGQWWEHAFFSKWRG